MKLLSFHHTLKQSSSDLHEYLAFIKFSISSIPFQICENVPKIENFAHFLKNFFYRLSKLAQHVFNAFFSQKKSFRLSLGYSPRDLQEHKVFLRFSISSTPFQICENAREGKFTHICIQNECLRDIFFVSLISHYQ